MHAMIRAGLVLRRKSNAILSTYDLLLHIFIIIFFVFPPIDLLMSTDNFDFYICMMTTIVFAEFGSQLTVTDKFVSYTSLVAGGFFYVYIHRLIN